MRLFLLFSLLVVAFVDGQASAAEGGRRIQIEWAKIDGAKGYELEWVKTEICDASGAAFSGKNGSIERAEVAGSVWLGTLQTGKYCLRVRGVSTEGEPGDWTDYQVVELAPKSPHEVEVDSEQNLTWEQVPDAEAYQVSVKNGAGELVYSGTVKDNRLPLPESVRKKSAITGDELEVSVQSLARGVRPSPARTLPVSTIPKRLIPRDRGLPPQPRLEPISAEEVVQRFYLNGERVKTPSPSEWANARTDFEKKNLRERTIAGSRIELIERDQVNKNPDIEVSAQTHGSFYFQDGRFLGNGRTTRTLAPRMLIDARFLQKRSWGAALRADFQPTLLGNGILGTASSMTLALQKNFLLDSSGGKILSFRVGPIFSTVMLEDSAAYIPSTLFGSSLGSTFRYDLTQDHSIHADAEVRIFPSQTAITSIEGLGGVSVQGQVEYRHRITDAFLVGGGISGRWGQTGTSDGDVSQLSADLGAYAKFTYRGEPAGSRNPASEVFFAKMQKQIVQLQVLFAVPIRDTESYSSTLVNPVAKDFQVPFAGDVSLRINFGRGGPVYFEAQGSMSEQTLDLFGFIGYSSPLFKRKDLSGRVALGVGRRQDNLVHRGVAYANITAIGPALELAITKTWNDRLATDFRSQFRVPISTSYYGYAERTGFPFIWNVGAQMQVRVLPWMDVIGGYRLEILNLSVRDDSTGPIFEAARRMIEHRFSVGFSLGF